MKRLSAYLPDPIYDAIERWSEKQGRSMSSLVTSLLEQSTREAAKAGVIQIFETPEQSYKSLSELVIHNFAALNESGKFADERLIALQKGDQASEVEILRIALILRLTEDYVTALPTNGEAKNAYAKRN